MPNFFVVRLGKDSEAERAIDAEHGKPAQPLAFEVKCKQVPPQFSVDDFVFIWLGSNNSQGAPTDWKQGLRAFGQLKGRSGGNAYNDTQTLKLALPLAFPNSIDKVDFLAHDRRTPWRAFQARFPRVTAD